MTANNATANYNKLAAGLAAVEADISNQNRAIERIEHAIENLGGKVNRGNDWGVFAAWSTVVIGIVGGIGFLSLTPLAESMKENRQSFADITARIDEHISDGHPRSVIDLINHVKEEVEENEAEAKREMAIAIEAILNTQTERDAHTRSLITHSLDYHKHLKELVVANREGIDSIDMVLQREMRLLDEVLQREMGLHVDRIDALIKRNDSEDRRFHEQRANTTSIDVQHD